MKPITKKTKTSPAETRLAGQSPGATLLRMNRFFRICLFQILPAVLLLSLAGCGGKEKEKEPKQVEKSTETHKPSNMNEVVATIGDMEITRELLAMYHDANTNRGKRKIDISAADKDELKVYLVDDLAISLVLGGKIMGPENFLDAKTTSETLESVERLLTARLLEAEVGEKLPGPTEKEIEEYYANNTEQFVIPFRFSMRQIMVSTYEETTTTESTTFESLAHEISGDVTMVDRILVNSVLPVPRAPDWNTPDRAASTKPLEPGESLLVPMSAERKKKPYERIEALRKRLLAGEDIQSVAKDSDFNQGGKVSEIKDLPHTGRPLLPQYLEAAHKNGVDGYSDIFETKHGYHIMQVTEKNPERTPPLEEVEKDVVKALKDLKYKEAEKKYFHSLFLSPDLKIDYAAIKNPDTAEDAVVLTLGDKSYTRKDIYVDLLGDTTENTPDEAVLLSLQLHKGLKSDLLSHQARKLGLEKDEKYQVVAAGALFLPTLSKYIAAKQREVQVKNVSEEDMKLYFDTQNIMTKMEYSFHYLPIVESDKNKAVEKITSLLADVKALDDFIAVIQENGPNDKFKESKGLQKNASNLPPQILNVLAITPVGSMSRPIYFQNAAFVFWPIERKDPRPTTWEETNKRDLTVLVRQERLKGLPDKIREELLEEAKVVMK